MEIKVIKAFKANKKQAHLAFPAQADGNMFSNTRSDKTPLKNNFFGVTPMILCSMQITFFYILINIFIYI